MAVVSGVGNSQPFWVRAINGVDAVLQRLGIEIAKLDEARLIRKAQQQAGLTDFGDDEFREGLSVLIASLQQEAKLNTLGRLTADQQITDLLVNRLRVEDYLKKHPDILQQEIKKPIFIAGLPRTGTTILHGLLAQDPQAQAPLSWQLMHPCPPSVGADNRIDDCRKKLAMLCKIIPDFQAIHPVGAEMPQECISINAFNFSSIQFMLNFDIPSYRDWYLKRNLVPTYRYHKKLLLLLNYFNPTERWVLKTPSHLGAIDAIIEVYPDACIIQTHRRVDEVMPSTASLYYALHNVCTDHMTPQIMAEIVIDYWAGQLNRAMNVRQSMPNKSSQFYDVYFSDLVQGTLGIVEKIYRHFELELTSQAKSKMADYLRENGRDKHGKHHYSAQMYGISQQQLTQHFSQYCNHFNLYSKPQEGAA